MSFTSYFNADEFKILECTMKFLPNDKILELSKLKAFADDNFKFDKKWQKVIQTGRKHCEKRRNCSLYVNKKLKFAFGWVENIVVKGENAGYQYFLLFPQ